ncbi:MAG: hypothetical protein ACXAC5_02725 [Promethearchaeota archaeon]|jgi:hypothetical protein
MKVTKISIVREDGQEIVFEDEQAKTFASAILKLHRANQEAEARANEAFERLISLLQERE